MKSLKRLILTLSLLAADFCGNAKAGMLDPFIHYHLGNVAYSTFQMADDGMPALAVTNVILNYPWVGALGPKSKSSELVFFSAFGGFLLTHGYAVYSLREVGGPKTGRALGGMAVQWWPFAWANHKSRPRKLKKSKVGLIRRPKHGWGLAYETKW